MRGDAQSKHDEVCKHIRLIPTIKEGKDAECRTSLMFFAMSASWAGEQAMGCIRLCMFFAARR